MFRHLCIVRKRFMPIMQLCGVKNQRKNVYLRYLWVLTRSRIIYVRYVLKHRNSVIYWKQTVIIISVFRVMRSAIKWVWVVARKKYRVLIVVIMNQTCKCTRKSKSLLRSIRWRIRFLSQSLGVGCYNKCLLNPYQHFHSYVNIPDTAIVYFKLKQDDVKIFFSYIKKMIKKDIYVYLIKFVYFRFYSFNTWHKLPNHKKKEKGKH